MATPVALLALSNGKAYELELFKLTIGSEASKSGLPGTDCLKIAVPPMFPVTCNSAHP
jgi:hypothetical protein